MYETKRFRNDSADRLDFTLTNEGNRPARFQVEPWATVDIPEEFTTARQAANGKPLPTVIEQLAPQLAPAGSQRFVHAETEAAKAAKSKG